MHSLAVCGAFCCIWGIICSLITLVPPLTSKPLRGMKWMAEWIDVYPFPLVHIHLAYRKTEWVGYKMSVSENPPKQPNSYMFDLFHHPASDDLAPLV